MPVPTEQPETNGRQSAHRIVDFLWDRVHISSGAAVLFFLLFCFTIGVYKIDHNAIEHQSQVNNSICHVVAASNQGIGATRTRLESAIARDQKQAKAEEQIASIWRYARRKQPKGTPRSQKQLVNKLIHAQETLAREDRSAATDLTKQLKAVKPVELGGC